MPVADRAIVPDSVITCPVCGYRQTEAMPTTACIVVYHCKGCAAVLRPRVGTCSVFCSFGDVPCPPAQAGAGWRPG